MALRFNLGDQAEFWPPAFEEHLHGIPTPELLNLISKDPYHPYEKLEDKSINAEGSAPTTSGCSTAREGTLLQPKIPAELPQPEAGVDYMHFRGNGNDEESFFCMGMLHPLPPQNGIIGWQRITFIKAFSPNDEPVELSVLEVKEKVNDQYVTVKKIPYPENCYAFEGVVLPGGKTMVGKSTQLSCTSFLYRYTC